MKKVLICLIVSGLNLWPATVFARSSESDVQGTHAFYFNLASRYARDIRVREALLLAYDFDHVNSAFHEELIRPRSTLDTAGFLPVSYPTDDVSQVLKICGMDLEDLNAPFESYGNSEPYAMLNQKARMLAATFLLRSAGYDKDSQMHLTILVHDEFEEMIAITYSEDLRQLGITTTIISKQRKPVAFEKSVKDLDYDIFATLVQRESPIGILLPPPKLEGGLTRPQCVNQMIKDASKTLPGSPNFETIMDAIERAEQAYFMNILVGDQPGLAQ